MTVIEEAHRLLANVSPVASDPEAADPRRKVVEQVSDMLAELRAYGEGVVIVEQIPSKIIPDAVKNTGFKIVHKLLAGDDRRLIGEAIGLNLGQMNELINLKPGEAVIHHEDYTTPFKIKIDEVKLEYVSDEQVRKHMQNFLDKKILENKLNVFCWYCPNKCIYREEAEKILQDRKIRWKIREILYSKSLKKYIQFINNRGLAYCILARLIEKSNIETLKTEQLAKKYSLLILGIEKWKQENTQKTKT